MKLNPLLVHFMPEKHRHKELIRIMKISFFILFICVFHLGAVNLDAQSVMMKVDANKISVRQLLSEIEKQTDFLILFRNNDVDVNRVVKLPEQSGSVSAFLEAAFTNTNVKYEFQNKYIVLSGEAPVVAAVAQQSGRKVTGTVVDETGEPVIGANILEKGKQNGAITDLDGNYSIQVADNATLEFSFMGYVNQQVKVGNQSTINVTLKEDMQRLDEIVIVGYGVQKKVNLTGSVSQITAKSLESRPIVSVGQGLQGVIPNLNVTIGGGDNPMGRGAEYNIRGAVSLNTANPLCLVDGVSMDINLLNPDDIESISVLKDAASAAIYGARASAGVILVTTKSGKSSKDGKTRVSYSNNIQWSRPTRIPDYVNTLEYMQANNEAAERKNGPGSGPYQDFWMEAVRKRMQDPANNPLTMNIDGILYYCDNENYVESVLRTASPRQKHSLNISRGTEKSNFYLSVGYLNENGMVKLNPDSYQQYNVNMSINTEVNKYLTVGGSYKLNKGNYDEPNVRSNIGSIWYALPGTPPYRPIQREDGHYMGQVTAYLAQAGRKYTDIMDHWLSFEATLNLAPNWFVKTDFSYNRYNKMYKGHLTKVIEAAEREDQYWVKDDTGVDMKSNMNDQYIFNIFSQYDKSFGNHNLTALVGFNQEWKEEQMHSSDRKTLISESIPEINLTTGSQYADGSHSHEAIRGAFFRLAYNWKQRYLFEANGRYDGTSRFPRDYRYKFFPSFSGAWRISEESFMNGTKGVLDNLKLRLSYGTLGNQQVSNTLFFSLLNTETVNWLFGSGSNVDRPTGVSAGSLINYRPTWEKTQTVNVALDIDLFSRLSGTFELYNRKTFDMLTDGLTLPDVLGAKPPTTNAADLSTRGWEVSLTWRDRLKNGFSYDITASVADNVSKITKYSSNGNKLIDQNYEGMRLGEIWGFVTDGIYQSAEEVKAGPDQSVLYGGLWEAGDVRYKDLDGDGKITYGDGTVANPGDRRIIGNTNPRYMFSLIGNAEYKGFDFNIFFQGVGKRDQEFTNFIYWGPIKQGYTQITRELYENTWNENRRNAHYPVMKSAGHNSLTQTRYLQNAAYMRLKNITLGYTLPMAMTKKIMLEKVRLYVSGQNLFEFTPMVKTFDPETTRKSGDAYPLYRSFSFGIQVSM